MNKLKVVMSFAALSLAATLSSTNAFAAPVCPAYGSAPVCNFVITFNADGSVSTGGPGGTYDGSDDTLVGVVNNTSSAISNFNLSSSTLAIFGFESDGVDTYGAPGNATDTSGYGGPNGYFTNISPDYQSGTVNFLTPIAVGSSDYFSLEEAIDVAAPPVVTPSGAAPEPNSLILLGTGTLAIAGSLRRRLFA